MKIKIPARVGLADKFDGHDSDWFYEVEGGPAEMPFLVRLGITADGSLVCTGLVIGLHRERITTRTLRTVHMGKVLDRIPQILEEWGDLPLAEILREAFDELPAEHVDSPTRPGRRGHPHEVYEEAAKAYRWALLTVPGRPTQAMAERLGVSTSTARRRIAKAREIGLLDEPAENVQSHDPPQDEASP